MQRSCRHLWLLAPLLLPVGTAAAAEPAAIIEEISAPSLSLQPMDYVVAGQKIALKPGDSIILSYLASCERERITGGDVVVGIAESQVEGGEVKRDRVDCDGGGILLTPDQAAKSGVMVFRAPPAPATDTAGRRLPAARATLFSLYPVIDAGPAVGPLRIERLDRPAQPVSLAVAGHAVDLAVRHVKLAEGGL